MKMRGNWRTEREKDTKETRESQNVTLQEMDSDAKFEGLAHTFEVLFLGPTDRAFIG